MNHWGRKLFALKPDDGLGGDTGSATQVPAGDTDPILEEPGYLAGGEEFDRDPALDGGGEAPDPFAGFSDEVRREAEKKGWKDPNDMFKAYDGAQSLIGRRDEERDRLQQERDALMAELQQRQQAPASADGPAAPGADPGWTVDFAALETAAGGDPSEMMRLYHENVVPQLLQDYGSHILKARSTRTSVSASPRSSSTRPRRPSRTRPPSSPATSPRTSPSTARRSSAWCRRGPSTSAVRPGSLRRSTRSLPRSARGRSPHLAARRARR